MELRAIILIFLIFGLALVGGFYLLKFLKKRFGKPTFLCETCEANSPRYCHLPQRPRAVLCDDYLPRGGGAR